MHTAYAVRARERDVGRRPNVGGARQALLVVGVEPFVGDVASGVDYAPAIDIGSILVLVYVLVHIFNPLHLIVDLLYPLLDPRVAE